MKLIFHLCSVVFTLYVLFHLSWHHIYEFGVTKPIFIGSPWSWEINFVLCKVLKYRNLHLGFLILNFILQIMKTCYGIYYVQGTFIYFYLS